MPGTLPLAIKKHEFFTQYSSDKLIQEMSENNTLTNRFYFGIEQDISGNESLVVCYRVGKYSSLDHKIQTKIIDLKRLETDFKNNIQNVINGLVTVISFGIGGTLIKEEIPRGEVKLKQSSSLTKQVKTVEAIKKLAANPKLRLTIVTHWLVSEDLKKIMFDLFAEAKLTNIFSKIHQFINGIIRPDYIVQEIEKRPDVVGIVDLFIVNNPNYDIKNPQIANDCIIISQPQDESHLAVIDEKLNTSWSSQEIYKKLALSPIGEITPKIPEKSWLHYSTDSELSPEKEKLYQVSEDEVNKGPLKLHLLDSTDSIAEEDCQPQLKKVKTKSLATNLEKTEQPEQIQRTEDGLNSDQLEYENEPTAYQTFSPQSL